MRAPKCENAPNCRAAVVAFLQGHHTCARHRPKGSNACTHSLAPSGSCSYCGLVVA